MTDTSGFEEDTMNTKLANYITSWLETDYSEYKKLVSLLEDYKGKAQEEVDGARGERNLAIHNTVREVYETQIALIEEILDTLEEGEPEIAAETLLQLQEALGQGETIG